MKHSTQPLRSTTNSISRRNGANGSPRPRSPASCTARRRRPNSRRHPDRKALASLTTRNTFDQFDNANGAVYKPVEHASQGKHPMISQIKQIFSDSNSHVRTRLFGIYGVLIATNVLAWALGAHRIPPSPCSARHRIARLWLRPAPRGRCGPHRRHRQRHPQTDAGEKAPGHGRLLLLAGSFDRRGAGLGRASRRPPPRCKAASTTTRRSAAWSARSSPRSSCSPSR